MGELHHTGRWHCSFQGLKISANLSWPFITLDLRDWFYTLAFAIFVPTGLRFAIPGLGIRRLDR